jgi:hypothetical protein
VPYNTHKGVVLSQACLLCCIALTHFVLPCLPQALKADVSSRRSAAFAKRLLQVAQESPPHFACGCLLMLSELLKVRCACYLDM